MSYDRERGNQASTVSGVSWWEALRRGYAPHQLAWLMDNPVRRLLLSPSTFANRFQISQTDRILEIGPGSGYFSVELARRVQGGRLELFDLQPEMLAKARRKLEKEAIWNVGYTAGNASARFPFPDAYFDIAVLVTVMPEIPDKEVCLTEIHRVLRAAGVVVFHEQLPDNLIRFAQLCAMVESAGFVLERRYGPSWNYTATFRKPLELTGGLHDATANRAR
jgi:ubiquinone/menaquinone biosynthesis C-methylase UbiE